VLQLVRDHAVDPQPPLLVFLVVGEVALEPFDVALVADDDGAAGEVEQRLFERSKRVDVEVVGRLVEQLAGWRRSRP
jgi:hypothetical protein